MTRFKVVSLPLIPSLLTWVGLLAPLAHAQLELRLETYKAFRQYTNSELTFLDGEFNIALEDGSATYQAGCLDYVYFPPSLPCPEGATGFVQFGNPDPFAQEFVPYYMITSITAAQTIRARREDKCLLKYAPQSTLPRPETGFKDNSFSLFYNIRPGSIEIREYTVTRYNYNRTYEGVKGGTKMAEEIVRGTYGFTFPSLADPNRAVALPLIYNGVPDGYGPIKGTSISQGVRFINLPGFDKNGFVQIDRNLISTVQWEGLSPSTVDPGDSLYFSVRFLKDPNKEKSDVDYFDGLGIPQAIFPAVLSGADPRVLLPSPYVSTYILPPFFESGTRGVIELELVHNAPTTVYARDIASRKYQLPVYFVDYYNEYADLMFGNTNKDVGLHDDFDDDGFNNLTEWALRSNAAQSTSVPQNPVPFFDPLQGFFGTFGFTIDQLEGMFPAVDQIVQVSSDGGATWSKMETDRNWFVNYNKRQIVVRSRRFDPTTFLPTQPPGTEADIYRIKVTLK